MAPARYVHVMVGPDSDPVVGASGVPETQASRSWGMQWAVDVGAGSHCCLVCFGFKPKGSRAAAAHGHAESSITDTRMRIMKNMAAPPLHLPSSPKN